MFCQQGTSFRLSGALAACCNRRALEEWLRQAGEGVTLLH